MVDVRQLCGEVPLGRQGLGRIERRERLVEAVRDTHPRGKAAPGPAALAVGGGRRTPLSSLRQLAE